MAVPDPRVPARTLIIRRERACRQPRAHLRMQLDDRGNALRLTQ